jgi:hypothetical protein
MDNKKPKIDATNPLYPQQQRKREDFHAVKGGTDSIRAGAKRYLPRFDSETDKQFNQRVEQSTIDGLVMMGVDSLCGKVFYEEIDVSGVKIDAEWLENFDNEGTSFNDFARQAFNHSFDGFSLLFVDGPPSTPALDAEKQRLGAEADKKYNLRPYSRIYTAANVLDWYYTTNPITRIKELTFLKLKEVEEVLTDTLEHKEITRYRILRLTNGFVTWELHEEKQKEGSKEKEFVLIGTGTIERVTKIPIRTIGCFTDDPKLLNESRIEIKTFDKESSFDNGERGQFPTVWTKGYDVETYGNIKLGSTAHIELPADENAGVGYVQPDPAFLESLKATIAQNKETIKARLSQIENVSVEKTATESQINSNDKEARLVVWADELKDALEGTLQFMAQMAGKGEDAGGEIVLRTAWVVQQEKAELQQQQQHEQTLEVKKAAMKQ